MLILPTGPIDVALGDQLSKIGRLLNVFGSTEAGISNLQIAPDEDAWQYQHFSPELPGAEFREQVPGLYEYVLVRTTPENDSHHPALCAFRDKQEWPLKDLFSKHPTRPNRWRYEGRTDDLIIFSDISKFNPVAFEEKLRGNPLIRYAIVLGNGRRQAAVLIELNDTAASIGREEVLAKIWEAVEAANEVAPKHAVVSRTHIIFAKPEKPMKRAEKGTVQKIPTARLYQEEIDELYTKHGDNKQEGGVLAPTLNGSLQNGIGAMGH